MIIDGFVTRPFGTAGTGVPVWFRGNSLVTTHNHGMSDEDGGAVSYDVTARRCDIILANESGVVALDAGRAADFALTALAMPAAETDNLARQRVGETLQRMNAAARHDRINPASQTEHSTDGPRMKASPKLLLLVTASAALLAGKADNALDVAFVPEPEPLDTRKIAGRARG